MDMVYGFDHKRVIFLEKLKTAKLDKYRISSNKRVYFKIRDFRRTFIRGGAFIRWGAFISKFHISI